MRFVIERTVRLLVTLFLVSLITFGLTALLPGDPAAAVLEGTNYSAADYEAVRDQLGLDEPLHVRYADWVGGIVHGDFGTSHRTHEPVMDAIVERAPVTLQIMLVALVFALLIAVVLAMIAASRAGGRSDAVITASSLALLSIPNFMLALLLIYVFSVQLGWFPATGWVSFTEDPVASLRATVLPALTLAGAEIGVYTRILRNDLIGTLQEDFITLARSKGASGPRVLLRHALRPSSLSLVTILAVHIGGAFGGSVIIETIFAVPGIGRMLVDSILQRDLVVVQGIVLFIALAYVLANFVVDLLYGVIDPRTRKAVRHG